MPHLRQIVWICLLAAITMLSGCRLDMHVQPKQNPFTRSDFFPDQRSERSPVEGTVARGDLRADTYFYTGKVGNNPGDYMPFPVTKEVLERGRERFNIYCSPCHSPLGDGNGFVPTRGFSRGLRRLTFRRLQKAPLGYFYDVMSNGFGIMSDYSAQISPRDRWNIVAYIHALQLSQNATVADVLPDRPFHRSHPSLIGVDGSGATLPVIVPAASSKSENQP